MQSKNDCSPNFSVILQLNFNFLQTYFTEENAKHRELEKALTGNIQNM